MHGLLVAALLLALHLCCRLPCTVYGGAAVAHALRRPQRCLVPLETLGAGQGNPRVVFVLPLYVHLDMPHACHLLFGYVQLPLLVQPALPPTRGRVRTTAPVRAVPAQHLAGFQFRRAVAAQMGRAFSFGMCSHVK